MSRRHPSVPVSASGAYRSAVSLSPAALRNETRLSCAAVACSSQTQFYYDGRRQLQPRVRRHAARGRTAPLRELLPPSPR